MIELEGLGDALLHLGWAGRRWATSQPRIEASFNGSHQLPFSLLYDLSGQVMKRVVKEWLSTGAGSQVCTGREVTEPCRNRMGPTFSKWLRK